MSIATASNLRGLPVRYDAAKDSIVFSAELPVQPALLSRAREAALLSRIESLHGLAQRFEATVPQKLSAAAHKRVYDTFKGRLNAVAPLSLPSEVVPEEHCAWAARALDFLSGSLCVAIVCSYSMPLSASQAAISEMVSAFLKKLNIVIIWPPIALFPSFPLGRTSACRRTAA